MKEIGRVFAAIDPEHDGLMPGDPSTDAWFESATIPSEAWLALEHSELFQRIHAIPHGGLIGTYEECWFAAPALPALVALIENEAPAVPPVARKWLSDLAGFARRASARSVGITLMVRGEI